MSIQKKLSKPRPVKADGAALVAPPIMLLANLLKKSANLVFSDELGLTSIEWGLIARLGVEGPMTQTEMAEKFLVDKGQLSRSAVAMARRGLIVRKSKTWRSIELRLAPKGRRAFAAIQRISRSHHRILIQGLEPGDLTSLLRSLHVISRNVSELLIERA